MKKIFPIIIAFIIIMVVLYFGTEIEGMKTFRATSTNERGREFVIKYDVKYLANGYGLLFANFSVDDDGIFAIDVRDSTSFSFSKGMRHYILYKKLNDKAIKEFGLISELSFWDKRGGWILIGLLFLVGLALNTMSNKKKPLKHNILSTNDASVNFLTHVAYVDGILTSSELEFLIGLPFAKKGLRESDIEHAKLEAIKWDVLEMAPLEHKLNLYKLALALTVLDGEINESERSLLSLYIQKMGISKNDEEKSKMEIVTIINKCNAEKSKTV